MHIYVIFNPNQEKNLLGYKVFDYSNYLNGVGGTTCNPRPYEKEGVAFIPAKGGGLYPLHPRF
jgi:hypothetical protein